jgi:hypothetical protein
LINNGQLNGIACRSATAPVKLYNPESLVIVEYLLKNVIIAITSDIQITICQDEKQ